MFCSQCDMRDIVCSWTCVDPTLGQAYLDRHMVHRIAIGGRKTMLELAVNNDFSLDVEDEYCNTPLHYAVLGKRMEVVRYICSVG